MKSTQPVTDLKPKYEFPITLGKFKTREDLETTLNNSGVSIDTHAKDLMSKPKFILVKEEVTLQVVVFSGVQLGFKDPVSCNAMIWKGKENFNLGQFPSEAGPVISISLDKEALQTYESFAVAMDEIRQSDDTEVSLSSDGDIFNAIFKIGRSSNGEIYLSTIFSDGDNPVDPRTLVAFVRLTP